MTDEKQGVTNYGRWYNPIVINKRETRNVEKMKRWTVPLSAIVVLFSTPAAIAQNCPYATLYGTYCVAGIPSIQVLRTTPWSAYTSSPPQYVEALGYYVAGDNGGNTIYQLSTTALGGASGLSAFKGRIVGTTLTVDTTPPPTGNVAVGQIISRP
jgi:hypothetical protein